MFEITVIIMTVLIILLIVILFQTKGKELEAKANYDKLLSQKKSSEVRLGQVSEQLAPFLKEFPYDPKKAHFLGMPVDYIVFNDNEVVFLEVKSGGAQLSPVQRTIKQLILNGKVSWKEMRINGQTSKVDEMPKPPDVQGQETATS